MYEAKTVVLILLLQGCLSIDLNFPTNFKFGASTSSYQIEGGWNADGKGEHMWDRLIHSHREWVKNNATGDIAADSYHQWREDVRIAAQLGLQFYRFSISWPRILPNGFTNKVNKAGARYYSDLIDALLAENIEPIVTLYHWELPVKILDLGGWTNPLIVDWFADYARVVFSLYAGRVKTWLTINEAISVCDYSYNAGRYAPAIKETEFAPYLCNKHVLLAHAKTYRIFEQDFKPKYEGRISISNYELWFEPKTSNDSDLAELGREHSTGRYSNPIYSKEGGWPYSVEKVMLDYSLKQGYSTSRLPAFTKEEIDFVKGTADFYALNYYTTSIITAAKPGEEHGVWPLTGSKELGAVTTVPEGSKTFGAFDSAIYPEGLRRQIAWVKQKYGNIDILITENGFSTNHYGLDDQSRVEFFVRHLEQVLLSIKVDNASVIGFSAWSLIDNFEWLDGFSTKFGLYEVDFEHPNRTRTARKSAYYYGCVIKNRYLNISKECYENKIKSNRSNNLTNDSKMLLNSKLFILFVICVIFNL